MTVAAVAVALSTAGTVTAKTLLTGEDIKDGTITTKDLRNGSAWTRDLSDAARTQLQGTKWASGQGAPTAATEADPESWYLDTTTGDAYRLTDRGWVGIVTSRAPPATTAPKGLPDRAGRPAPPVRRVKPGPQARTARQAPRATPARQASRARTAPRATPAPRARTARRSPHPRSGRSPAPPTLPTTCSPSRARPAPPTRS